MKRQYLATELVPCWVEFSKVVTAESAEEARQLVEDGLCISEVTTKIGESIDFLDVEISAEELPSDE